MIESSNKFWLAIVGVGIVILLIVSSSFGNTLGIREDTTALFDGQRAFTDLEYQVNLGPRIPGSQPHAQAVDWIVMNLQQEGWVTEIQATVFEQQPIKNIIAKKGEGKPWIIIGAHYDTRMFADNDPNSKNWTTPVPGANDGASGVAVLLELARVIPEDINKEIWLVFFDAEDNGRIPSWDWILGSRAFVEQLEGKPDVAVIVDMIGDSDLNIYYEKSSDENFRSQIWTQANQLEYTEFIPMQKYQMIDDHTPFISAGIPAVLIIDFDYPYWHTTSDTLDQTSPNSLEVVGSTLLNWLVSD